MEQYQVMESVQRFVEQHPQNTIPQGLPDYEDLAGMVVYQPPLLGFASAEDPLFIRLKEWEAVGPQHMTPEEWLPAAKSVISFFLPFTREIKESNYQDMKIPSREWLYGRLEGQTVVDDTCQFLVDFLRGQGFEAVAPSLDARFRSKKESQEPQFHSFASNWSERHAAYICGLGTFGLSKGLITKKGIAGRFGSVITSAPIEPTQRAYAGLYDYCTMCGKCGENCPVNAITVQGGKDHRTCSPYVDLTSQLYAPRLGCGKCQVNVPCQDGIPNLEFHQDSGDMVPLSDV